MKKLERINTTDAFKLLDEGKIMESITFHRYKKEGGLLLTQHRGEFRRCGSISAIELEDT